MLTQLTTVKDRLAITVTTYDTLLTNAIKAVSDRFDQLTNRTLSRTTSITQEFPGNDTEIILGCYPIESVTKFELKSSETEGWVEQTGVHYLIRNSCIISLSYPFCTPNSSLCIARVTYTGGYVLPGDTVGAGQTALPNDLEQAAVEQVAYWYRNKDTLGLIRNWPNGGTYEVFRAAELLPQVESTLQKYERWNI